MRNAGIVAVATCGILVVVSLLIVGIISFGRIGDYDEADAPTFGDKFTASTVPAYSEPAGSAGVHSHSYSLDAIVAPGCSNDGYSAPEVGSASDFALLDDEDGQLPF